MADDAAQILHPAQPLVAGIPHQTEPTTRPQHACNLLGGELGSNQCHACATSTASTLSSGSGISSAVPSRAGVSGSELLSSSSISGIGSTATTPSPRSTSRVGSLPVPAPRSGTSEASGGNSQSIASGG